VAAIAPTIIAGGFPCQSFSQLGKREGFDNAQTGALFMHVIRLLEAARPPVVLLENVRGLLNHDGGQTMSVVVRSLENLGYVRAKGCPSAAEAAVECARKACSSSASANRACPSSAEAGSLSERNEGLSLCGGSGLLSAQGRRALLQRAQIGRALLRRK
jgi:hypothetical protein